MMNEGGGQRIRDVGTIYNGTAVNNPVYAPGQYGNSLKFNGTTQYVTAAGPDTGFLGALTINAWVNSATTQNGPIITKTNGNGAQNDPIDFEVANLAFTGLYAVRATSTAVTYSAWKGTGTISNNKWYNIGVTYADGSLGTTPSFWINGVADAAINVNLSAGSVTGTNKPVIIGSRDDSLGTTGFNGRIFRLQVWSRALSAQEIRQLYEQPFIGVGTRDQRIFTNSAAFKAYWATRNNQIFDGMVT